MAFFSEQHINRNIIANTNMTWRQYNSNHFYLMRMTTGQNRTKIDLVRINVKHFVIIFTDMECHCQKSGFGLLNSVAEAIETELSQFITGTNSRAVFLLLITLVNNLIIRCVRQIFALGMKPIISPDILKLVNFNMLDELQLN